MNASPLDPDLAYRLLCAANLAYGVTGKTRQAGLLEALPPIMPDLSAVASLRAELGLRAGSFHAHEAATRHGIDAFLYGETEDLAVLAFRGTLPMRKTAEATRFIQIAVDWLNNTRASLVDGRPLGLPGHVHQGYAESLDSLWNSPGGLVSVLDRIAAAAAEGRRLWVTGHSKGGALALLAGLRLAETGVPGLEPAGICTFGAPRAGNLGFAAAFEDNLAGRAWRFEYRNDIVPHLPPAENFWFALREACDRVLDHPDGWSWPALAAGSLALNRIGGYESVGRLQFIDWGGRLRDDDTLALRRERWENLGRTLATALPDINRDHLPMRGYGYMDFLAAARG